MVTPTTENVSRSKELLPDHQSGDLVRQGHRAQRQSHRGPGREITIESKIAADDEIEARGRPIFPFTEHSGKSLARQPPTAFVEDHEGPSRFERPFERPRFLSKDPTGIVAATARDRFQDSVLGWPTLLNPSAIRLNLFVECACAAATKPENADPHRLAGAAGSSIPRAASSIRGASPQRLSRP